MAVEWDRPEGARPKAFIKAKRYGSESVHLGRSNDQESRVVREMRRGQVRKIRPAVLSSIRPTGYTSSFGTSNINGVWSPALRHLHWLRLRPSTDDNVKVRPKLSHLHEVDPNRVRHVFRP